MHDIETLRTGGYKGAGLTQLKLRCPLAAFPDEILELGDTLEQLDLSGTGLSSLPANLGSALPNLKAALFSNCNFKIFPGALASCPALETAVFRNNGMEEIPEDALPPRLRCLILTGNRLTSLPSSIGRCERLQQCMLAGNQLRGLPAEMANCKGLTLLRLSSNRLSTLPPWLFTLSQLAFLSFASNPCASPTTNGLHTPRGLASIAWSDLEVQQPLDANTSLGLWHQSPHYAEDVAIKLFRDSPAGQEDENDDDGSAADEMAGYLAAGAHESLVTILGRIHSHPDEDDTTTPFQGGLITQRIPEEYTPLDTFPPLHNQPSLPPPPPAAGSEGNQQQPPPPPPAEPSPSPLPPSEHLQPEPTPTPIDAATALAMLTGLAHALSHLHSRGLAHGSLRPHAILASAADAHALLTGFRAATLYGQHGGEYGAGVGSGGGMVEKVEVLAFGRVVEYFLGVVRDVGGDDEKGEGREVERGLAELGARCVVPGVEARPGFGEVVEELEGMMGWRGMMRIPDVEPR